MRPVAGRQSNVARRAARAWHGVMAGRIECCVVVIALLLHCFFIIVVLCVYTYIYILFLSTYFFTYLLLLIFVLRVLHVL